MSEDDKFYRDIIYKMMGFGIVILITYFGWMLGTGDKEKFICPFISNETINARAEEIALREYDKDTGKYLNKFDEVRFALEMRRDRGFSLLGFFIGSLFWVGAIIWAHFKIQDRNQKTIPNRGLICAYCFLVIIPQILAMYFIFKDVSSTV